MRYGGYRGEQRKLPYADVFESCYALQRVRCLLAFFNTKMNGWLRLGGREINQISIRTTLLYYD